MWGKYRLGIAYPPIDLENLFLLSLLYMIKECVMDQQKNETQQGKRPFPWRAYGYLAGVLFLGVSVGLLLYPYLTYPAIGSFVLLGMGILLIALTAPLLRK